MEYIKQPEPRPRTERFSMHRFKCLAQTRQQRRTQQQGCSAPLRAQHGCLEALSQSCTLFLLSDPVLSQEADPAGTSLALLSKSCRSLYSCLLVYHGHSIRYSGMHQNCTVCPDGVDQARRPRKDCDHPLMLLAKS